MEVFEVAIGAAEAAGNFRVEVVESPDGAMASAVVALDADGLAEAVLASRVAARPLAHDESPVRPASPDPAFGNRVHAGRPHVA